MARKNTLSLGSYSSGTLRTQDLLQAIRKQIRELRLEMKEMGIRKVSPFNGGLSQAEYRYNARLFALEVEKEKLGG